MKNQAVLFDMGGTIETYDYTSELCLKRTPALQKLLQANGIDLGLSNQQLLSRVTGGLARYKEWSIQTLDELSTQRVWDDYILAGCSYDKAKLDFIAEELMVYVETRYYHREMRKEIPFVLESIKQMGLKIGLISNVCSQGQVPVNLKLYGIQDYFDPVVLSSKYGRRKPDPAIFHYAARLANVPTGACVYIGDRIARDILGARQAGFKLAIHIKHDFAHGEIDTGAIPDATISNMIEVIDILREKIDLNGGKKQRTVKEAQPVCAFLFDAGDILYHRPRGRKKLAEFLFEQGLDVKKIDQVERKKLEHKAFVGGITQDQYREDTLKLYGLTHPDKIEIGKEIILEEDNDIEFFEGISETLKILKEKGYYLGVITDTAASISDKLRWFEQGGFGDVWDSMISSKEIGVHKPDPKIYQASIKQLGIKAEHAVFVGHKSSELGGAREFGMQTVAFNYDKSAIADFYIDKFSDLLKIPIIQPQNVTED